MQLALSCKHRSKPTNLGKQWSVDGVWLQLLLSSQRTAVHSDAIRVQKHCRTALHAPSYALQQLHALLVPYMTLAFGKHSTGRTPDETRMQVGGVFISRLVAALRPVQTRRDVLVPRVVTHSSGRVNTNVPQ